MSRPFLAPVLALALMLAMPGWAQPAEVFRWTDEYGQVVYGTWVPERYRANAVPANAPLPRGTSACEAKWHRYLASAACFDQYRVVGGGLKPEAYQYCTEVPRPDPCT
ncbi:DUF4124 domain-containing protein [Hydrogenophaga sp. BPS33]|uniref:DUF4124 domain-containing protein n=1 Tax=Hydrogenophaga sp. BPS33 TaxID=2651974 RepID=UPI00131FFE5F|nr:DUF4124 domain-containing protein [Hydrogenophaga sp. BPS33]QHE87457.1 DUF4124 domain-containing protein [Hydrogenophaga sp. BPS33]